MEVNQIHNLIIQTEELLRPDKATYPGVYKMKKEWTMWLPKTSFPKNSRQEIILSEVRSPEDWQDLLILRTKVESALGIKDQSIIQKFIDDIRRKMLKFDGTWFLARLGTTLVGEIGLVIFDFDGRRIGRLQDVDIIPTEQGKGYGNQLLNAVCKLAIDKSLEGLCLMATEKDWPKIWYQKFGFIKVGKTLR